MCPRSLRHKLAKPLLLRIHSPGASPGHLLLKLHRKNRKLPSQLLGREKVQARNSQLHRRASHNQRVAALLRHLHAEPANMPNQHANRNPELCGWLHWLDNAHKIISLPESLWRSGVARLRRIRQHMREVDHQPDQRNESRQPRQRHCTCGPQLTPCIDCPSVHRDRAAAGGGVAHIDTNGDHIRIDAKRAQSIARAKGRAYPSKGIGKRSTARATPRDNRGNFNRSETAGAAPGIGHSNGGSR